MGYLVRPSCPKCGDNRDVDEIVVHSGKKTASGAAAGAALGSVVPGLGDCVFFCATQNELDGKDADALI